MDELIQLLESFGIDVAAAAAFAEDPTTTSPYVDLTDEQLADLHQQALALFDTVRDGDTPDLEVLRSVADLSDALLAEDTTRQEASAQAATEIAELEQRIRPAAETAEDGDDDAEPVEGDEPAEDAPAEPAEGDGEPAPVEEAVAAAAAIPAIPRRVPLSDLAARRTAGQRPNPADHQAEPRTVITAGADIPGVSAGQPLADMDAVAAALVDRVQSVDGVDLSPGQKFQVARARTAYPEERTMSDSDSAANAAMVASVVASAREAFRDGGLDGVPAGEFEALAAAGGLCVSVPVRYEQDTFGVTDRPVADGLPGFAAASRGGVRFMPPPTLATIATSGGLAAGSAVSVWNMTDDLNALNGQPTKPIQRITCGSETTVNVYAIVERLLVGTVLANTDPERVRAFIDLVLVAQARLAEGQLLARIKSLSTQLSEEVQALGSRRDLLAVWAKAAWSIRNRERMSFTEPLQLIVPDAVVPHSQIDGLRQLPGDQRDRLTREEFVGEMRAIGVEPIITPDMPAHIAGAQSTNGGQLVDLPSPIEWSMFPMGTFAYLDGGVFDLGFKAGDPIRDTATLNVNDYQLFAESWENVAKFGGPAALWGRSVVCPTGTTSATTAVNCDLAS